MTNLKVPETNVKLRHIRTHNEDIIESSIKQEDPVLKERSLFLEVIVGGIDKIMKICAFDVLSEIEEAIGIYNCVVT